ncbi:MAG: plasmid stabilization protein [Clostridium sp.]
MEKEILELLKKMDTRLSNLEEGQKEIKLELSGINKKLDGITEQTADLTEFRTTVISKLDELKEVEEVTKVNCYDIAKLKSVK